MVSHDLKAELARNPGSYREPASGLTDSARHIIDRPYEKGMSPTVLVGLAQLVEALLIGALGIAIYAAYVPDADHVLYLGAIGVACLLLNIGTNLSGAHRVAAYRSRIAQTAKTLAAWAVVFLLMTTFAFLFKLADSYSRVWMVTWLLGGAVLLTAYRLALRRMVIGWTTNGRLRRRAVIVGGGPDAAELIQRVDASNAGDIELLGLFDDRDDDRSPDMVADYPKLGRISDLVEFARRTRVDLAIVSMPLSAETRVLQMLKKLWILPIDIRLSSHMSKLRFQQRAYSFLGDLPVFDIVDKPISDWNIVLKWVFDKCVAVGALIVLSPVMVATAIAIKLDSKGPVFFRQKRHGFNNELIDVFKFRSMYTDMSDIDAAKLVTRDDPRVTRIGKFIRKTSIDELPQLFNVLKGELSIVGPRPHALQAKAASHLYHEAVDGYFARHKVKPGITGWAQINGWRGETDTVDKLMQRVNHDLYYIEHWSILLDIYILFMTPFSLVSKNENAF